MIGIPPLLAYFGPEVQLPVASAVATFLGVALMLARAPLRYVKGWIRVTRR